MKMTEIIKKFLADSSWLNKAKELLADKEKMRNLLGQFKKFFQNEKFKDVIDNMSELLNYVKDVVFGDYKNYDITNLLLIVAAIIYVVTPIDIIPDLVPGIGLSDDLAVIMYVLKVTNEELCKYRNWKKY